MKNLLIIGARGFGREIFSTTKFCRGYNEEFIVKGFLDSKSDALDGLGDYPPIIDSVEHYQPQPDDVFICALGDVHYKKKYTDIILQKGGTFINLIHKQAYVSNFTKIGYGCIIFKDVSLSNNAIVGNFVTLQQYVTTGHDMVMGDYCEIESFAFIGGYATIGDFVTIHTGAIITPHQKIGNHAVVGAGAVVIRRVKENTTVFGNPAVRLKF